MVLILDYLRADREVVQYINDTKPFLKLHSNRQTPYTDYLIAIHNYLKPQHYLEIGVNDGFSFALVDKQVSAHGVDTKIKISSEGLNHHFFEMTSDSYFSQNLNLQSQLSFVDGLHTAKQAFIDFVNCYNSTEQHGFIVIDDILPESLYSCQPFRVDSLWHGDVLKILPLIRNLFPFITLKIIDCSPGGLAIIQKDNAVQLSIPNNLDALIDSISILKCFLDRNNYNIINDDPSNIPNYLT